MKNKRLKVKERIKKYFTEKPKQSFWFHAFIIVLIFRYVTPLTLIFLMFFQVGLIAPEADMSVAIETASGNIANTLVKPMETLFDAGANIAIKNPIISKVIFYALSYFVYIIYFAMIVLIVNLSRYFISWIIRKKSYLIKSNWRK